MQGKFSADIPRIQEYQENEKSLIVENGELNQIVSLFGCKNSTIVIKGKVNAVTIGEPVSCLRITFC